MYRMVIVYKHEEPEEVILFKDKETAEYFRNYFYKDDNIAYVRIDEIWGGVGSGNRKTMVIWYW